MTHPDDNQLTTINPSDSALAHVGQVANRYTAQNVFADYLSRKVDVLRLQEAGGWNSLAMPRRYVEESKIANDGMV